MSTPRIFGATKRAHTLPTERSAATREDEPMNKGNKHIVHLRVFKWCAQGKSLHCRCRARYPTSSGAGDGSWNSVPPFAQKRRRFSLMHETGVWTHKPSYHAEQCLQVLGPQVSSTGICIRPRKLSCSRSKSSRKTGECFERSDQCTQNRVRPVVRMTFPSSI